jgi:hypothetical protein
MKASVMTVHQLVDMLEGIGANPTLSENYPR